MKGRDRRRHAAHVVVAGLGRVEREPDVARATFTAEATRETAGEARSVAAAAAAAVIGALRGAGIGEVDLRTSSVDVSPAWEHRADGPVRTGFTVASRLSATIRDMDAVGSVIDAALAAGATALDGVSFDLADSGPAAAEARRLAVLDARARAEAIAGAAGTRLGDLVEVAEAEAGAPGPRPLARMAFASAGADVATPVLPGRVTVSVGVTARWELR